MAPSFIPGPLLGQTFPLSDGVRVRLRLAHFSDGPAIAALIARTEGGAGDGAFPDARLADRLVQFDPRQRYVLCACALIDSSERLVGVGAIDLGAGEVGEPDLIVIDPELDAASGPQLTEASGPQLTEALTGLLWGALVGAASAMVRARAA